MLFIGTRGLLVSFYISITGTRMTSRTKRIARDYHEIVARPISRIGVSIQEDDIGKNLLTMLEFS